jgi:hypothetical protein
MNGKPYNSFKEYVEYRKNDSRFLELSEQLYLHGIDAHWFAEWLIENADEDPDLILEKWSDVWRSTRMGAATGANVGSWVGNPLGAKVGAVTGGLVGAGAGGLLGAGYGAGKKGAPGAIGGGLGGSIAGGLAGAGTGATIGSLTTSPTGWVGAGVGGLVGGAGGFAKGLYGHFRDKRAAAKKQAEQEALKAQLDAPKRENRAARQAIIDNATKLKKLFARHREAPAIMRSLDKIMDYVRNTLSTANLPPLLLPVPPPQNP